ncbi:MAG: hypothetical protein AB8G05_21875 [Oligoflexales bacterium]
MTRPSTKNICQIQCSLPISICCEGKNVEDTQELNPKQISLFIERDIHEFLKRLPILCPIYGVSLVRHNGIQQIRVHISILYKNAIDPIQQRIENILWSYNKQIFLQKNGTFHALPPKLNFKLEITGRKSNSNFAIYQEGSVNDA